MARNDPVSVALLDEIRKLSKQLAQLEGEEEALAERRKAEEKLVTLREQLETLKIEKGRREEEFARERREVEHATGLFRKQSEWEAKKAVEEARLTVREENLTAERVRFEAQMDFHKQQIKSEVDRLESLLSSLMERLPTVTVEKAIDLRDPRAPRRAS